MKRASTSIAVVALIAISGDLHAAPADYLLGPQDHLKVKVYDWRYASGDAHEWTALLGEFVVNAAGNVSFPIVGDIPAANLKTSDLAAAIATRLQKQVGLAQPPVASVEVFQYRPFYIIGTVDKPGEYAFRPGLTVLQALGIAGGLQRISDQSMSSLQREAVSSRGDVNAMRTERALSRIRLGRLQAEIDGAPSFDLQIVDLNEDSDALESLLKEEHLIFATNRSAMAALQTSTRMTKDFLAKDIATLTAKRVSVERQLDLSRHELDGVASLVTKGLVVSSRLSGLEQTNAQYESSLLDIQLAVAKAQQDSIRADRELKEATDKARNLTLAEAADLRNKVALLDEKIATAQTLASQADDSLASNGGSERAPPKYLISRMGSDGRLTSIPANESDPVAPGDTVRVDRVAVPSMQAKNDASDAVDTNAKR